MHPTHRILARAAGKRAVLPGDVVEVAVDLAFTHDRAGPRVVAHLQELGDPPLALPKERVVVVMDHEVPPSKVESANAQSRLRNYMRDRAIVYETEGICHQVLPEKGHVLPGLLIVGTDSHTTTLGAFGAFACGIGATELVGVLVTGRTWLKVPRVIRVDLEGEPPEWCSAKDVALHVLGRIGPDGAQYKVVEFAGSGVRRLSMAGRMVLCNMAAEMGAKAAFVDVDEVTMEFWRSVGVRPSFAGGTAAETDGVEHSLLFDLGGLEPQVACPHSPHNVVPLSEVAGRRIDQAFIGSCTNGRLEDLRVAAKVLEGRRVHEGVRLIIAPASADVWRRALEDGTLGTLARAGACILNPNCASCTSIHLGMLADGEVSVASTNRNFRGRRGSYDSEVYLASPAVVAASAVAGCLAHPRDVISGRVD